MSLLRRWFERKTIQPGNSGKVMMPAFKKYKGLRAINVEYSATTVRTTSMLPWVKPTERVVWNLQITTIYSDGFRVSKPAAISDVDCDTMLRLAYLRGVQEGVVEIRRRTDSTMHAIQ